MQIMRKLVLPMEAGRKSPALVLVSALTACAPSVSSIAPTGLAPLSPAQLAAVLAPYQLAGRVQYQIRWRLANPKGSTAGRAVLRIAPPDSLRFDYRGPFGRAGAAVLVADSAVWAQPERQIRDLIPTVPLFWAVLGLPRAPPAGSLIYGRADEGRAWRYVVATDTTDFVEVGAGPERLLTEARRAGRIVASGEVRFRPGTRLAGEARLRFPKDRALLMITVEAVEHFAVFERSIWRRP